MLFKLNNEELYETYVRALQLGLEKDFIYMLKQEVKRRRAGIIRGCQEEVCVK
jgi:hypothetical protein